MAKKSGGHQLDQSKLMNMESPIKARSVVVSYTDNSEEKDDIMPDFVPTARRMFKNRSNTSMGKKRWSVVQMMLPSNVPSKLIEHHATQPLLRDARVGFSILNLTGHPIRYLQHWDYNRKHTVEYLDANERGLLNFIASNTVVRDNYIVEESFENLTGSKSTSKKSEGFDGVGHQVALQIAGFQWLKHVQADSLGITFEDLIAVTGIVNVHRVYDDWKIRNSLKLVAKVKPYKGGRMLQLSSVFSVKNFTTHAIKIMANDKGFLTKDSEGNDEPFILSPGNTFHVPIALMHRTLKVKKSLGYLWLAPAEIKPIIDELGISTQMVTGTSYTVDPINLMHTVDKTSEILSKTYADNIENFNGSLIHDEMLQLSCVLYSKRYKELGVYKQNIFEQGIGREESEPIDLEQAQRVINFDELPPFCYNIEIETKSLIDYDVSGNSKGVHDSDNIFTKATFMKKDNTNIIQHSPFLYTIGTNMRC